MLFILSKGSTTRRARAPLVLGQLSRVCVARAADGSKSSASPQLARTSGAMLRRSSRRHAGAQPPPGLDDRNSTA